MRRVVVTGLGLVTPLASGVEETWSRLLAGRSGIRRIEHFDVSDLPAKIGGVVPKGDGKGDFKATDYVASSPPLSFCAEIRTAATLNTPSPRPLRRIPDRLAASNTTARSSVPNRSS